MDDVAGWFGACLALAIAAVAVGAPARSRRSTHVLLAVALLVEAGVLILPAVRDSRNAALRLEETVLQMEEILQEYEKHNQEMVSNFASMLSKNPGNIEKMSYHKAISPDGTENVELTITMEHADVDQPPDDDSHTDKITETPKPDDNAPPGAAGSPSPAHGTAAGERNLKPWRIFSIPQDHVLVLDCADDELTLHVRPPSAGLNDDEPTRGGAACSNRQQQQPFLYDYGSYRTLFVSPPGKERIVPVLWVQPEMYQKLVAAMLRGEESPEVKEQAVPESFPLSPDVVLFYRPVEDGTTELLLSSAEVQQYKEVSEEVAARAGTALTPPTILSTSFPDFSHTMQ